MLFFLKATCAMFFGLEAESVQFFSRCRRSNDPGSLEPEKSGIPSQVKAHCCGAMPTPPNKSPGLEARSFWGSEAALSERSEFSRFPPKASTADAYREAGRCSGGVGIAP
jgi:hypothetical protein